MRDSCLKGVTCITVPNTFECLDASGNVCGTVTCYDFNFTPGVNGRTCTPWECKKSGTICYPSPMAGISCCSEYNPCPQCTRPTCTYNRSTGGCITTGQGSRATNDRTDGTSEINGISLPA
jgi:hypothetical protein